MSVIACLPFYKFERGKNYLMEKRKLKSVGLNFGQTGVMYMIKNFDNEYEPLKNSSYEELTKNGYYITPQQYEKLFELNLRSEFHYTALEVLELLKIMDLI